MSETERRRKYVESRVLMSSAAILNPTFDDGDLYFTGAQIELMRNLVQYANRPDNYAAQWEQGYYLVPDDSDWDEIQAIVADLEETLMGNPNTLWGYTDNYIEWQSNDYAQSIADSLDFAEVPAGQVWVVTQWSAVDVNTQCTSYILQLLRSAIGYALDTKKPTMANEYLGGPVHMVLKEGDAIRITFLGTYIGDDIHGYKMVVP